MSSIKKIIILLLMITITGCVVVPVDINNEAPIDLVKCSNIEHEKALEIVNINEQDSGYYFSVIGFLLSPILIPVSTLVSGTHVILHNASLSDETMAANEACLRDSLSQPAPLLVK